MHCARIQRAPVHLAHSHGYPLRWDQDTCMMLSIVHRLYASCHSRVSAFAAAFSTSATSPTVQDNHRASTDNGVDCAALVALYDAPNPLCPLTSHSRSSRRVTPSVVISNLMIVMLSFDPPVRIAAYSGQHSCQLAGGVRGPPPPSPSSRCRTPSLQGNLYRAILLQPPK